MNKSRCFGSFTEIDAKFHIRFFNAHIISLQEKAVDISAHRNVFIQIVLSVLCPFCGDIFFKCFRMDLNPRTKSRQRRVYHQNEVLYITKVKALYIIIAKEDTACG